MASQMDYERVRGLGAAVLVLVGAVAIMGAVQAVASRSTAGVGAAVVTLLVALVAAERISRAVRR
jgi:hypothetical protein